MTNYQNFAIGVQKACASKFRGKESDRFYLTREQMREALNVPIITDKILSELDHELRVRGFLMLNLDYMFCFLKIEIADTFQKLMDDVFHSCFIQDYEESDDDSESGVWRPFHN